MTQYANGEMAQSNGLLRFFYNLKGIFPSLIFMGVGAMTDFGPLIANPKSLLLGAAAQLGIFVAFLLSLIHIYRRIGGGLLRENDGKSPGDWRAAYAV